MLITILLILLLFVVGGYLFYASYHIGSGVYLKAFCRKQTQEKLVALTFDDGPDPEITPLILEILKEQKIKAAFFCTGRQIRENRAIATKIVEQGHLIGNHSYNHSNLFPLYNRKKMEKDLLDCQKELQSITGKENWFFRPPFGVTNPTIGQTVKKLGLKTIGWSIRTLDTQKPGKEKIIERIRKQLRPGTIILLHDTIPDNPEILMEIISFLKEKEYRIVRVDELM